MSAPTCDWCGSTMTDIGQATTGFEAQARWRVWLCDREGCGHEREAPQSPSSAALAVLDAGIESAKRYPIVGLGSFAQWAEDE